VVVQTLAFGSDSEKPPAKMMIEGGLASAFAGR